MQDKSKHTDRRLEQRGKVVATGSCCSCGRVFLYDPALVPTIDGDPMCQHCVERTNPERIALGLPPIMYDARAYP